MRASRIRRTIIVVLSALLIGGYFLIDWISPGSIQLSAQQFFSALATRGRVTATPEMTPTLAPTTSPATSDVVAILPTLTQTPLPAPLEPGSMEIAFASTRAGLSQIFIADLRGGTRQLTDMKEGACQPAWSPDGKRLVFVSPCAIKQDTYRGSSLYVINEDGSELRPLNTVPGGDFEPDWSPDGRYIAFTSMRTGHMQIYSYDLSSGITQRLIRTPRAIDARQPAWSPDGKQIAFAERGTQEAYEIWIMSNLGRDPYPLVRSGAQFSDLHPEWSPDGKVMLFHQTPAKRFGFPRLFTIAMEPGADPIPAEMSILSINNVDFSSDGFWLAFEFNGERGSDVYYMTPAGAGKTEVSPDPADDFDPAWRPVPKP